VHYYIFNLTSYVDEVIEELQGGFRCNRLTTDQISDTIENVRELKESRSTSTVYRL
jgi:hypothetical protein